MKKQRSFVASLLVVAMVMGFFPQVFTFATEEIGLSYRIYSTQYNYIAMDTYSRNISISTTGSIAVADSNWHYGLITIEGDVVLPFSYDDLEYLTGDYFKATQGDLVSVIDSQGNVVKTLGDREYIFAIGDYLLTAVYDWPPPMVFDTIYEDALLYEYRIYDRNFQEVSIETFYTTVHLLDRSFPNFNHSYSYQDGATVTNGAGEVLLEGSTSSPLYYDFNHTYVSLSRADTYKITYDHYDSDIFPFIVEENGVKGTRFLNYYDGTYLGSLPFASSNINEQGYFIVENDNWSYSFGRGKNISWLPDTWDSGETPETPEPSDPQLDPVTGLYDVPASHWSASYVAFVSERGLMSATDLYFEPNTSATRGMIAEAMALLGGSTIESKSVTHEDVMGTGYENAIAWVVEQGIMGGRSETTFGTEDNITREEFSVTLRAFAQSAGIDTTVRADYQEELSHAGDFPQISSWSLESMAWTADNELLVGYKGFLRPKDNITRAEVATVLYRYVTNFNL